MSLWGIFTSLNKNKSGKQVKKIMFKLAVILLPTILITSTILASANVTARDISDTNEYWIDEFQDLNKIENSSNIVINNGEVKIIGPGFNYFTNAYSITPSKKGSWQTIDVSELIPKDSTGVILKLMNTNKWKQLNIAVRTPGSSDQYQYSAIRPRGYIYALCGVDENRKFETYLEKKGEYSIFLVGYTDSAVYFYQNRIDKSLSKSGSWEEIDLTDEVPEDATGAIFQIINTKDYKLLKDNNRKGSIRTPGSNDDADNTNICEGGGRIYALCGIKNGKIEGYIESGEEGNIKHYLVGYTKYPITFLQNPEKIAINNIDSWRLIDTRDKTSRDANGIVIEIRNSDTKLLFSSHQGAIRKIDSLDERRDSSYILSDGHIWGLAGTDINQRFEANKGNKDVSFRLLGYSERVGSGYLYSTAVAPPSLKRWCTFSWNDVESSNTDVKYQLEYYHDGVWMLIPEKDLPGNTFGFDDSPVKLNDLDIKVYSKIRLKATLSKRDITVTPKIKDWGVTWQNKENEWSDSFSTNYLVGSTEKTDVESEVILAVNHSNWYTYGGTERRVSVPEMDIGPTTNNLLWKANVTGTWDTYAGAIIVDGVVYICGKDWGGSPDESDRNFGHAYTFALDAKTGEKIWMFPTGPVDDNPVYYKGRLFVQTTSYRRSANDYSKGVERLWCLDAVDGSVIWVFYEDDCESMDLGSLCGTPAIAEDKNLVIALSNNYLYGVNMTTGRKAWSIRLPNARNTPTSPTYYNGVVYAACETIDNFGDWLYAYDVYEDHVELKWATSGTNRRFLGTDGVHDSSPVIYNYNGEDRLYIGCKDGNIRELDLITGEILRTYDIGAISPILGSTTIYNDVIFAGAQNGIMYAVDLSDFSLKWKTACGKIDYRILMLLDRKGWYLKVGIFSTAAVANGIVYYGSLDNNIYALSENTGEILWKYKTGYHVWGQAAISDGIMYLGSDDWYLYAFGPESGPTYRYYTSGDFTSTLIEKSDSMSWDKFYASDNTPAGTSITYQILDENNNVICTVEDGDDISNISQDTIMLSASLKTKEIQKTPVLQGWKVTSKQVEQPWSIILIAILCIITLIAVGYISLKYYSNKKK